MGVFAKLSALLRDPPRQAVSRPEREARVVTPPVWQNALDLIRKNPADFSRFPPHLKADHSFQAECFNVRFYSAKYMVSPSPEVVRQYSSIVARLHDLGIESVERLQYLSLAEAEMIINNRSLPSKNKQPIALVVYARKDMGCAAQDLHFAELVRKQGYCVLLYESKDIIQFAHAITEAKEYAKRIGFLGIQLGLYSAHGGDDGTIAYLDDIEVPGLSFMEKASRVISVHPMHREKLDCLKNAHAPGGLVVLDICSAAKGGTEVENLARMFFLYSPESTVLANPSIGLVDKYRYDNDKLVWAKFADGYGRKETTVVFRPLS